MVWTPLGWGGLTVNNRFTRACGQAIISVWLKQTRIEMKRIQQAKETTFRNRICKGTFRASTPVHICTYANELPLQYLRNDGILTAIIATLPPWTTGNEKGIRGRDDIKKRKGQDTFKDNEHCKKAG